MGMAFSWRGCSLPTTPPPPQLGEDPPLLRTRGYVILRGSRDGSVGSALAVSRCVVGSSPRGAEHFGFSPSAPRLGNQNLDMSSLVYATGHMKDPVPLIAKRRGLSPGGRFPPNLIHQVIIITGLNKLYNCMFSP